MSRLIVHPGAPKTGTSTIQAFLECREDALRAQGIGLLTPRDLRRSEFMRSYRQVFAGAPGASLATGDLKDRTGGAATTIMSEEGLCAHFLPGRGGPPSGIDHGRRSADLIADLPFDDVRVVLTVRNQADLLRSAYLHHVKLIGERRPFARWLREAVDPSRLSWRRPVSAFRRRFGRARLSVVPFEIVKAGGSEAYLAAVLKAMDVEIAATGPAVSIRNRSPSGAGLAASRIVNAALGRGPSARWLNKKIVQLSPVNAGGARRLNDPLLTEISARYADENAALAATWFPEHASGFLGRESAVRS
ncbi:MAG: hypothetical protein AAF360_14555 [Pseudomonadota bacterium]